MSFLSYAERPDADDSNLQFVVIALAIIAVVGLMSAIPATIARRRGHRRREGIVTSLILWAIFTAGCAIYAINAQMKYSSEYNRRVLSGYLDPRDTSDRPKPPWAIFVALGLAYGGIIGWIALGKNSSSGT